MTEIEKVIVTMRLTEEAVVFEGPMLAPHPLKEKSSRAWDLGTCIIRMSYAIKKRFRFTKITSAEHRFIQAVFEPDLDPDLKNKQFLQFTGEVAQDVTGTGDQEGGFTNVEFVLATK
jgi:hypothetical protein